MSAAARWPETRSTLLESVEQLTEEKERLRASCRRLAGEVSAPRVLVIEDDPEVRAAYLRELGAGAELVLAVDSSSALKQAAALPPDLILSDSVGLEALRELRGRGDRTPAILLTGYPYPPRALAGLSPLEVRRKPLLGETLRALVARLVP
jgi:CheY-like chemotaxis protein